MVRIRYIQAKHFLFLIFFVGLLQLAAVFVFYNLTKTTTAFTTDFLPSLPPSNTHTHLKLEQFLSNVQLVEKNRDTRSNTAAPLKHICFIIQELEGLTISGGIGTAYAALLRSLGNTTQGVGYNITLLLTSTFTTEEFQQARKVISAQGIHLAGPLQHYEIKGCGWYCNHAYSIFCWLRDYPVQFNVVHFHDYMGLGYYSFLAKHESLFFEGTVFVLGVHGPLAWTHYANGNRAVKAEDLEVYYMERRSVELADYIVSASAYMFDWMTQQGWVVPEQTSFVHRNLVDLSSNNNVPKITLAGIKIEVVREIVFFGRLETRKGVSIFCDAVEKLLETHNFKVTFLGRHYKVNDQNSLLWITKRVKGWDIVPSILSDLNRRDALAYLAGEGRVAVIPSLEENSPYTVIELLELQLPFLASKLPGILELINPEDAGKVLFLPNKNDLYYILRGTLENGAYIPSPSCSSNQKGFCPTGAEIWLKFHDYLTSTKQTKVLYTSSEPSENSKFIVSVCITHRNRPVLLQQALDSLYAQDFKTFEVVLVDDASDNPEAQAYLKKLDLEFKKRDWQLHKITGQNIYVGAARNYAAKHARGKYLMFMDDDNYAKPHEISTFVKAATSSKAQVLTSFVNFFSGKAPPMDPLGDYWIPSYQFLGGAVELGLWKNVFGDANLFISSKAFSEIGGFLEEVGLAFEDWEFLARAALFGHKLEVVPIALFWKRSSFGEATMLEYGTEGDGFLKSYTRIVDTYSRFTHKQMKPMFLATQNEWLNLQQNHKPVFTQPPFFKHCHVEFEHGFTLVGVSGVDASINFDVSVTQTVLLGFVWKATEGADSASWTLFVHLRDIDDNIIAQADDVPRLQDRTPVPTDTWLKDEVITDVHMLELPLTIQSDTYYLFIGWFQIINSEPPYDKKLRIVKERENSAPLNSYLDELLVGTIKIKNPLLNK